MTSAPTLESALRNTDCCVCLTPLHGDNDDDENTSQPMASSIAAFRCGHLFHAACAAMTMAKTRTCPLCRAALDDATGEDDGHDSKPARPALVWVRPLQAHALQMGESERADRQRALRSQLQQSVKELRHRERRLAERRDAVADSYGRLRARAQQLSTLLNVITTRNDVLLGTASAPSVASSEHHGLLVHCATTAHLALNAAAARKAEAGRCATEAQNKCALLEERVKRNAKRLREDSQEPRE